ncbi:15234_t:CDS:2, partial [Acaulospora morrowiae]
MKNKIESIESEILNLTNELTDCDDRDDPIYSKHFNNSWTYFRNIITILITIFIYFKAFGPILLVANFTGEDKYWQEFKLGDFEKLKKLLEENPGLYQRIKNLNNKYQNIILNRLKEYVEKFNMLTGTLKEDIDLDESIFYDDHHVSKERSTPINNTTEPMAMELDNDTRPLYNRPLNPNSSRILKYNNQREHTPIQTNFQLENLSKDLLNKESPKTPASLTILLLLRFRCLKSPASVITSIILNEKQFSKGSSIYNFNASSRLPSPPLVDENEELNTH